ncbi:T9SS type A sorting domain-containing protein [Flammeovirga sp. EKP202]|uniref:T9SS type A sorting domain-containing protein n=1 Tax=Flammeovirga sp. EKP202 TaxID=2770592 RepID=UPI00165F4659|nr:T9SS type A sorting domain-containing protein [Flammeovirga sp. EKP202]MBD0399919.1 T9SS type A sorting domain-containing protein [Flammeovirga sp. EKP202]
MKKYYCFFLLLFTAQFLYGQCEPVDEVPYTSSCTYDAPGDDVDNSGDDIRVSDSGDPLNPTVVTWNVNSYTVRGWTLIFLTNFGNLTVDEGTTLTINGDFIMAELGVVTVNGTLNIYGDVSHNIGTSIGDRFIIGPTGVVNVFGDLDLSGPFGTGVFGRVEGQLNVTGTIAGTENLPVELTYLKASQSEGDIVIEWETATEVNASHFDVERSTDRKTWEKVGTLQAEGNSQTAIYYQFEDESPLPRAYYRLKQVDFDDAYVYYGPIVVSHHGVKQSLQAMILPNHISGGEEVQFSMSGLSEGSDVYIQVFNNNGHRIHFEEISNINSNNLLRTMDFTSQLGSGMYYIVIKSGQSTVKERLLVN